MEETIIGTDIARAAELLRQGELVAIPTETVYGLAGNGLNETAVRKIFAAKSRPLHNPLILHFPDADRLSQHVQKLPPLAWQLLDHFTPGPLTLLLPKHQRVPDVVTAGLPEVAVRIPQHPVTLELLRLLDFPLAAPSANAFGGVSPTEPAHVMQQLSGRILYILDGGYCQRGIESTVVGFEDGVPVVYRPGAISLEEIQRVAPGARLRTPNHAKVASPGLLSQHYSPRTALRLLEPGQLRADDVAPEQTGVLALAEYAPGIPEQQQVILSPSGDLNEAAYNLYAALYKLDALGLSLILAERVPNKGIGVAINDRLTRAAATK
jgi:L-threonylcarbamoyladenylate synthase